MISLTLSQRLLFGLTIAGIVIAGYLTITHLSGAPIVCSTDHGCDIIRASSYSKLWGIPIAVFGLGMFLFIAGLQLVRPAYTMTLLTLIMGAGVAVSAYLTYLEAYVIHAWCSWCVAQAIVIVVMFVTLLATQKPNQPKETQ